MWGNITTKGDYMEYILEYHTDSVKPWTVLARRVGQDYWTQVAPWYYNRGIATRKLKQLKGEL